MSLLPEQIGVRHGDVAVRQRRDRRRGLVAVREQTEMDLATMRRIAADFVAGGIVTLADDGAALRVIGVAQVGPHHDVAAILQRSDLAVELGCAAVGGVDLRPGLHEVGGGGHILL
jgi:hypothetical protein